MLLILAGVTIATLTGDNGLLQKATSAKEENEEAIALEKIKVEVAGSYGLDGKIDKEQLNKNLSKINGLIYNDSEINLNDSSKQISILPAIVYLNGNAFTISESGTVNRVAWIYDKADGSYINDKTGQKIKIGDRVKYEDILPTVQLTSESKLITDLAEYSGNNDNEKNTASTILQEKDLQWKIFDIKDGQIRLISAKPTTTKIGLYYYNGYNNGVYLLDETCNTLYSSDKGNARNLKKEDIAEKFDKNVFDYTQTSATNADTGKYGGVREYTGNNLRYPNLFEIESGCKTIDSNSNSGRLEAGEQKDLIKGWSTASEKIIAAHTYWSNNLNETNFENKIYSALFLGSWSSGWFNNYWLSSRAIALEANQIAYEFDFVESRVGVKSYWLYYTNGAYYKGMYYPLRPVVVLDPGVQLEADGQNVWKIK